MSLVETKNDLLKDLNLNGNADYRIIDAMVEGDTKYLKDLRINLKNAIAADNISVKEAYLIALSVAVNEKNVALIESFTKLAKDNEASESEIAEIHACTSLLSVNNVFYRFRHFVGKDSYNKMPAKIKMNVMLNPVLGKPFFELVSLVISALNGCETCVKSHEAHLIQLGVSEERIFDSIRLASVVKGLCVTIN